MSEPSDQGKTGAGEPALPPAPPVVELPPPPFTIDQLLEDSRTRFEVGNLMRRADQMEDDRDRHKRDAARARTEAAETRQLHERYQKAMREAESEFRDVSVAIVTGGLIENPGELGHAIRLLAKKVRDIGPERDALRGNVSGLQKEKLNLQRDLNERDTRIATLEAELRGSQHQVKLFEGSTEAMQRARDNAMEQRDKAKTGLAEAEETNEHLTKQLEASRARIKEVEGERDEALKHLREKCICSSCIAARSDAQKGAVAKL